MRTVGLRSPATARRARISTVSRTIGRRRYRAIVSFRLRTPAGLRANLCVDLALQLLVGSATVSFGSRPAQPREPGTGVAIPLRLPIRLCAGASDARSPRRSSRTAGALGAQDASPAFRRAARRSGREMGPITFRLHARGSRCQRTTSFVPTVRRGAPGGDGPSGVRTARRGAPARDGSRRSNRTPQRRGRGMDLRRSNPVPKPLR